VVADQASLFIRPEKIRIEARGEGANGEEQRIPGQVLGRAYLGDHSEYLIRIGEGVDVRVPAAVETDWPEDADVDLAINRKDIFLYT
jgi:ABC-type Fe3+/spermidine/putrescine transport system ATPase subunit